MKKILFLTNSLGGGGAERVLVNLVNRLDCSKYDMTIQTIFSAKVNSKYLSDRVRFIEGKFASMKGISRLFKIIPARVLYGFFIHERYDIIVSYLEGITMKIISGAPREVKKIVWLHNERLFLTNVFWSSQIKKVFSGFDKIVGVSDQVCESFKKEYGVTENVTRIYNTNDVERIYELSQIKILDNDFQKDGILNIITLGRLDKVKGYDRLLKVVARLKADGYHFRLFILGTGIEKDSLEAQQRELNLQDCVYFKGFHSNPYPYLASADLFVCSSIREGLNTAMAEAIILGVPVISTRVSGAAEVLGEKSEYGLVVDNNDEALYSGLKTLLGSSELLDTYRRKAKERSSFFNPAETVKAVEDLFDKI